MKIKQVKLGALSLILLVALLVSISVPASCTTNTVAISFGQVNGKCGERVVVPVRIENNPGIASFRFRIAYDADALTYVAVSKGDAMTGGTLTAAYQEETKELAITWFNMENIPGDGVLFNLVFDVAESASGVCPLAVSYLPEDIVNAAWNQVNATVTNGAVRVGSRITGTITSYGSASDEVTIWLMQDGEKVKTVTTRDGTYLLQGIANGTYQIVFSKKNHVAKTHTITVESSDISLSTEINLMGDVTGDGKVNMKDWSRLYNHISEISPLTDYPLQCGDVTGDGKVNMKDWSRLYNHISEVNPLW